MGGRIVRTWGLAALPALLLAGCGGDGEDFAVEVKRPPAAVSAPLLASEISEARVVFPGLTFGRSRPSDTEILYTIPGTGSFPATIRFQLEPLDGGQKTVIHAFVKVPAVQATIDGQKKYLSEAKIERELEQILKTTGRSLEMGSDAHIESQRLSTVLMGVAIATDEKKLARAMTLKDNPGQQRSLMLAFGNPGETPEPNVDGSAIRAADPDAGQRMRDIAQAEADRSQELALDKAAAPTNDLERYDN